MRVRRAGLLAVRIEARDREIVWSDFQQPHRRSHSKSGHWSYKALPSFTFDRFRTSLAISKVAADDIWILAVGLRGTPTIPSVTDPAAFDIIAAHRIDVSEIGDDDSVFPWASAFSHKF